jgi:hypothetical protein
MARALDSLIGVEIALAPWFEQDFRESLYRLIGALTSYGITILMTVENTDNYRELRFSPHAEPIAGRLVGESPATQGTSRKSWRRPAGVAQDSEKGTRLGRGYQKGGVRWPRREKARQGPRQPTASSSELWRNCARRMNASS